MEKMEETPINLQFPQEQTGEVFARLREWQSQAGGPFLDAEILVRYAEADDDDGGGDEDEAPKLKTLRVHAVVLAASCDYLRGLWASGFSEAADKELRVQVDDAADAVSAEAMVKIVYGYEVSLTFTELLELHRFADLWQCRTVLAVTQKAIEPALDLSQALKILDQAGQPNSLLQLAADSATKFLLKDDLTVSGALGPKAYKINGSWKLAANELHEGRHIWSKSDHWLLYSAEHKQWRMMSDRAKQTGKESRGYAYASGELHVHPGSAGPWHVFNADRWQQQPLTVRRVKSKTQNVTFAAAVRLLLSATPCSNGGSCSGVFAFINLEGKRTNDIDHFCRSSEWLQVPAAVMSDLVQVVASKWDLDDCPAFLDHLSRWAQLHTPAEDLGCIFIRLAQLYKQGCEQMLPWLRNALCRCNASLPLLCELMEAAFGPPADGAEGVDLHLGHLLMVREPKRRRTGGSTWAGVVPQLETAAKEMIQEAALEMAAARFAELVDCDGWLKVSAPVVLKVAVHAVSKQGEVEPDALRPVVVWAEAASSSALFTALNLAHSLNAHSLDVSKAATNVATCVQRVWHAICFVAEKRLEGAERQNDVLQGGRHQKELEDAVVAAVARERARAQEQQSALEAVLRKQLSDQLTTTIRAFAAGNVDAEENPCSSEVAIAGS